PTCRRTGSERASRDGSSRYSPPTGATMRAGRTPRHSSDAGAQLPLEGRPPLTERSRAEIASVHFPNRGSDALECAHQVLRLLVSQAAGEAAGFGGFRREGVAAAFAEAEPEALAETGQRKVAMSQGFEVGGGQRPGGVKGLQCGEGIGSAGGRMAGAVEAL